MGAEEVGAEEVGAADKGIGERGRVCPDFGNVICGSCAGSTVVWVGDMGYVPAYWENLGQLPPQGGTKTDGKATVDGTRGEVYVYTTGEDDDRGGTTGYGDLFIPPTEHSCPVHRDQAHCGTASGGGDMPWDKGVQAVVGE